MIPPHLSMFTHDEGDRRGVPEGIATELMEMESASEATNATGSTAGSATDATTAKLPALPRDAGAASRRTTTARGFPVAQGVR